MIQIIFFTGLMAIFQIEAVSVQAVHIERKPIYVTMVIDKVIVPISETVQVIRRFLGTPKVITGYNKIGVIAEDV